MRKIHKYLFIAEKNSLKQSVEATYRKHQQEIEQTINGKIIFTALHGHLCGYAKPNEYPEWNKKWRDLPLPMVPTEWKIIIKDKKAFTNLLAVFKNSGCDRIIVGTDADVEGNGIYYLIEQKAGWENIPAYRFFNNDLTDAGIRDSLLHMTDYHKNSRDVRMTECFLLRSTFDWLIGMNLTVGASVKLGKLMKIGRVKSPTLKLIYDNCMAIDHFKPETTYLIQNKYQSGFIGTYVDEEKEPVIFKNKAKAEKFISVFNKRDGKVEEIDKKTITTYAPKLYNLSDLQFEAGKKYGYSPKEVLEIAQSLYEKHKVLTYPRTDGQYISKEKAKTIPQILNAISIVPAFYSIIEKIPNHAVLQISSKTKYVNDEKVKKSSHDALLPTTNKPVFMSMSEAERNIYTMVVLRLLCIFFPPLQEEKTTAFIRFNGYLFKSTGVSLVDPGWTFIIPRKKINEVIPPLQKGEVIKVEQTFVKEKTSTPPKRFSKHTLLKAMANISAYLEEQDYKQIMVEESGIGTQATRASIIEELEAMKYFEEKKKTLYITDTGKEYIENLEGYDILNPELTAKMELSMKKVKEGDNDFFDTAQQLKKIAIDMTEQTKQLNILPQDGKTYGYCPVCKEAMVETQYYIQCIKCDFQIPKQICGIKLTKNHIQSLQNNGFTEVIHGFISKKKKKFSARLCISDGKLVFSFDDQTKGSYSCPICGKPIHQYNWGYSCEGRKDDSCHFSIGNIIAKKEIPEKEIKNYLKTGKTNVIDGFVSKNGNSFSAALAYDKTQKKMIFSFSEQTKQTTTSLKCPKCGKNIVKRTWGYSCIDKECRFSIGEICGKKLTEKQIKKLITERRTDKIEGFISKKGNKFDARLILNESGMISFDFD